MRWHRSLLFLGLLAVVAFVRAEEDLPEEYVAPGHEDAAMETKDDAAVPVVESANLDAFSDEQKEAVKKGSESHEFQAEVNRLMDIIINSLYTQKEVFLRELISNSADALEKVRYLSVTDQEVLGSTKNMDIRVEFDSEAKTLSIQDTGIGMTKQDLINNLGTVAKSGTTNFLEAMSGGSDLSLIGQFGVGFYSTFLVADKVTVVSKHKDDEQYIWESTADASFTVAKDPRGSTLGRGSRVTLHLKEDATEYLSESKLKDLVKKFSQFIAFPIYLKTTKTVTEEEIDTEAEVAEGEEPKKKKVTKKKSEWEQLNTQKAIWLRSKDEVTEEDYVEFYKTISKDYLAPLTYTHFNAEGEIEFKSILYIPSKAQHDMFDNYFEKKSQMKLYVRRVLVADSIDELMPKYLHFVRGVVDSDDLPLNVSREQLQQHKIMKVISKKLVRKVLELIKKLAKDAEQEAEDVEEKKDETEGEKKEDKKTESKYEKFYKEFSRNLKLGCYEDDANRSKIAKLLRFHTSKALDKQVSLDAYVDRMPETQDSIYYMAGESKEVMMKSPHIQMFLKKNIEVVFLTESMDEPCIQKMTDFEGKKFVSIQKGDIKLDETDTDKLRQKKLKEMYEPLLKWWKEQLGESISKVELSKRLVSDPCTVVASQWGYSAHMEKIMKSQAFANQNEVKMMTGSKIFELNPNHPVIIDLLNKVKADKDDAKAKATASVLFKSAMIAAHFDVEDPSDLASSVYKLLSKELGVDPEAPVTEVDVGPLEEEKKEEASDDDDEETDSGDIDDLEARLKEAGVTGEEENKKDEL
eukprot:GDKI01048509.1.p1 GENE.GDKI01048509.1~~GDKI01048509.1.p1  ORF type:complete len:805 (+),score=415.73 GDKI01048509.1:104-2518(+)